MTSPVAQLGRLLLAAGCSVAACPAAGCTVATGQHVPRPRSVAVPLTKALPRSLPSPARTAPVTVPAIGGDPARLAAQLTSAEAVLGRSGASTAAMTRQALTVQMVCLRLAERPGWAGAVIRQVAPAQRAAAAADIAATADLVALTPPASALPRWRIVSPESLAALRADYRAAQAATGVGWSYLAAINFVETNFGRIAGLSSAGAEGPMQFLPGTWAIYGRGDVHRARDAIFAAARLLASHGAPANTSSAVYAYNPSSRYVDAVQRYASRLRANPNALTGYYHREVIYRLARGWVVLPPGYGINPAARAIPLGI
jgi:membrane-bound lytic murein transglycosylase B